MFITLNYKILKLDLEYNVCGFEFKNDELYFNKCLAISNIVVGWSHGSSANWFVTICKVSFLTIIKAINILIWNND